MKFQNRKTAMNHIIRAFLLVLFVFFSFFSFSSKIIDTSPEANTLHEAVFKGDIKKVRAFIKKGVDVNLKNNGHAPLHYVAKFPCCGLYGEKWKKKENIEIAKLLIKQGADVNVKISHKSLMESTPLKLAIYNGLFKVAELLIKHGADVNTKNKYGYTLLHNVDRWFSSDNKTTAPDPPTPSPYNLKTRYKTAKLLIEKGADVNAKNGSGDTPLHSISSIEITKLLIEHGADVNAENNIGETPLHQAIYEEIARLLIKNGADVNAKTKKSVWNYASGSTPLHHALNTEIAKVLLENGADINARNKHEKTPIDTLFSSDVKDYLKSKGGYSGYSPILFIKNLWNKIF